MPLRIWRSKSQALPGHCLQIENVRGWHTFSANIMVNIRWKLIALTKLAVLFVMYLIFRLDICMTLYIQMNLTIHAIFNARFIVKTITEWLSRCMVQTYLFYSLPLYIWSNWIVFTEKNHLKLWIKHDCSVYLCISYTLISCVLDSNFTAEIH